MLIKTIIEKNGCLIDSIMGKVYLRKFMDADKGLMEKWLLLPHVAKWYEHPQSWLNEIDKREGEFSFISHFIVELGTMPIGFCQFYACSDAVENWYGNIPLKNTYSIDYLIGEVDYLGRGYGKQIIKCLIDKLVVLGCEAIIVQPEKENLPSCRALVANGFKFDESNQLYILLV